MLQSMIADELYLEIVGIKVLQNWYKNSNGIPRSELSVLK